MPSNLSTGRTSFRPIIDEIPMAVEILQKAGDAHRLGDHLTAEALIRQADMPELRAWLESIWGKGSEHIHYRAVAGSPASLAHVDRVAQRMPESAVKRALIERDGHHCRLCGMPVIRAEVRQHLHRAYPDALPWGRRNSEQHAAFQVLWLQYDHLIPHARGGSNDLENMLIACAACNFGRMNFTLAEVGFAEPATAVMGNVTRWDGLESVLTARASEKVEEL